MESDQSLRTTKQYVGGFETSIFRFDELLSPWCFDKICQVGHLYVLCGMHEGIHTASGSHPVGGASVYFDMKAVRIDSKLSGRWRLAKTAKLRFMANPMLVLMIQNMAVFS
jgi:hypothetical protein